MVQNHLTAGATWGLSNGKEINVAYQHAFKSTLNGVNSLPIPGANANLHMYQDSLGLSFGWGR